MLPDGITNQFTAKCVVVPPNNGVPAAIPDTRTFPQFSYFGNEQCPDDIRKEWSILSENGQLPNGCAVNPAT